MDETRIVDTKMWWTENVYRAVVEAMFLGIVKNLQKREFFLSTINCRFLDSCYVFMCLNIHNDNSNNSSDVFVLHTPGQLRN